MATFGAVATVIDAGVVVAVTGSVIVGDEGEVGRGVWACTTEEHPSTTSVNRVKNSVQIFIRWIVFE